MRVLAICETIDFQNFTRRYTIEALARIHGDTTALCHTHIRNWKKTNLVSEFLQVQCFYGLVPFSKKKGWLRRLEYVASKRWRRFFKGFDIVLLSSPNQNYFLDYVLPAQKVVYLISDPYCLMGYAKEKESEILQRADLILATSQNLASNYIKNYYNIAPKAHVVYWPNCVDVTIWQPKNSNERNGHNRPVIGFAGNFMKLVDLHLLEKVVQKFNRCQIVICGKISHQETAFVTLLERIIAHPNVSFKAFIPYNQLPAEVQHWDVCIMLDNVSELSSYHHHNKLYQYLALGKPVVARRNHIDYDSFAAIMYLADSHEEYIAKLEQALNEPKEAGLYKRRIQAAFDNSADVRARQLKTEMLQLCDSQ